MNKKRPVNLELSTLKFPVMAIASILHRISGVVLFLLLPAVMYFLHHSLLSEEGFNQTRISIQHPLNKFLLWGIGAAAIYHILAGIRHLFMDTGHGEELVFARRTASIVIILSVILSILLGLWICEPTLPV